MMGVTRFLTNHALGRSRGGLITMRHMVCDRHGFSLALSAGQCADSVYLTERLEKVRLPGRSGQPRKRSRYIVANKGFDSDALRHAPNHSVASHASTPETGASSSI